MNLTHLSDDELLASTASCLGNYRQQLACLVAHLGEIEERKLHVIAGYSSMFDFCVNKLRMSDGEAHRRIVAARAARRFPVVFQMLESGVIHLSALEILHKKLTVENHAELLGACCNRSKREVEEIVAAHFPVPDAPSRIQALPETPELALDPGPGSASPAPTGPRQPEVRPRVTPTSARRFKIEFTAGTELRDKLERVRDLMSHSNPSRDLAPIIDRALDLLIADLEKKQFGKTDKPRHSSNRKTKPGYVTRETRRQIAERDEYRCCYVSPDGRRCEARAFLQVEHRVPRAQGGEDGPENARMFCYAHNDLVAEQAYGREHIEQCRNFRQRKRKEAKLAAEPDRDPAAVEVFEKVRLALTTMGFRRAQAQRAVSEVARKYDGAEIPVIQDVLRAALLIAT